MFKKIVIALFILLIILAILIENTLVDYIIGAAIVFLFIGVVIKVTIRAYQKPTLVVQKTNEGIEIFLNRESMSFKKNEKIFIKLKYDASKWYPFWKGKKYNNKRQSLEISNSDGDMIEFTGYGSLKCGEDILKKLNENNFYTYKQSSYLEDDERLYELKYMIRGKTGNTKYKN